MIADGQPKMATHFESHLKFKMISIFGSFLFYLWIILFFILDNECLFFRTDKVFFNKKNAYQNAKFPWALLELISLLSGPFGFYSENVSIYKPQTPDHGPTSWLLWFIFY